MPIQPFTRQPFLTTRYRRSGTRFRVYPQPRHVTGLTEPETVHVNSAPGTILAGPQDERIYVVDARNKRPYPQYPRGPGDQPPYAGPRLPPARPDAAGHFDHIGPDDPGFRSATVFAAVRCVLEIWEAYFGRRLTWHFRDTYRHLEIVPTVPMDNATSRYGYVEFGFRTPARPYCENFEVVAHEVGHLILKSVMGNPAEPKLLEFRAHEEASADIVAMIASLHFESVVDRVLERTRGKLFSTNMLSRIAEGATRRNAFNNKTMTNVRWHPNPNHYKYDLSLPFTGAVFDILVELYEARLVARGAIPRALAERSTHPGPGAIVGVQRRFAVHFRRRRREFKRALVYARDQVALLLARTWARSQATDFSYARVVGNMLAADAELTGGRRAALIRRSFEWRRILPPPSP